MRFRIAILMCFIFAAATSLAAQTRRSVTNADLEKYKQARLGAEREYRENYERLGLPSPEELELRRRRDRAETEALAERLRSDRISQERIQAEREASEQTAAVYARSLQQQNAGQYYQPGYLNDPGYFWSYGRRYQYPRGQNYYQQPGYFAGGQFWPTGPSSPPQPLIARPRSPRR